jgi:prefoldin subunit 5
VLFLELFLFGVVGAVGLGDRVVVELGQGISAELVGLSNFIKAYEVLLFLASK